MPRVLRTYQQNFIGDDDNDTWTFRFATIPHKAKKGNRFKVSVASITSYTAFATTSANIMPQIFWMKGLGNSIASTASGNTTSVNVNQVSQSTILGICGNALDIGGVSALYTQYSNTSVYSPYYFYLDEMPTNEFSIFYTDLGSYVYSSLAPNVNMLITMTIEEEED